MHENLCSYCYVFSCYYNLSLSLNFEEHHLTLHLFLSSMTSSMECVFSLVLVTILGLALKLLSPII